MAEAKKKSDQKLPDILKELEAIEQWFDASEEINVEAGLVKAKRAVELIKLGKSLLQDVENEFHQLEAELDDEDDDEEEEEEASKAPVDPKDIPF